MLSGKDKEQGVERALERWRVFIEKLEKKYEQLKITRECLEKNLLNLTKVSLRE